jgi:glycogen phosphorylase
MPLAVSWLPARGIRSCVAQNNGAVSAATLINATGRPVFVAVVCEACWLFRLIRGLKIGNAAPMKRVAYFCMEYGLSVDLTIYSGGLGVLAGDYMKSAGDLKLPVTGVGLLWDEGYTNQTIDADGQPVDQYAKTRRDVLAPVEASFSVTVKGTEVRCRAYRVTRYTDASLYLIEPVDDRHRWITKRLYGGGSEDRVAQEILLGVGGVRLLRAIGREVDVYHFNEGHAVFAGLELLRELREANGQSFAEALATVRKSVVFTTHTPVKAGNESHELDLLEKMGAAVGHSRAELEELGGEPFSMTVAGLRLSHKANAVAALHSETARGMWKGVKDAAPILSVTNGVHVNSWQDARIRAATVIDRPADERRAQLWRAHQAAKRELIAEIAARTNVQLDADRILVGFARRAATYKRADLILGDPVRLQRLIDQHGIQLVFSGKAHPRDNAGKKVVSALVAATRQWPKNVVFVENYDMALGAMLTRGSDIWLNNPRRPMEASGTSGMKAAMNGVLNCSILDGWWPEGCQHGTTGWRIVGDYTGAEDEDELDIADREAAYNVLEREVLPMYRNSRARWLDMMEASIAMSRWRFSSDRMIEDYYRLLY